MKAVVLKRPGHAVVSDVEPPVAAEGEVILQVHMVGLCGSDLTSYRGRNPLVSFPRIPGHEVAASIVDSGSAHGGWAPGTQVTLSPYTNCNRCAACLRSHFNACQFNQTLGVQRDGALSQYLSVPAARLYRGNLGLKELCLVEPLTVGFHAAARGHVTPSDTVAVFGCGAIGLGAIAGASFRRATVIGMDLDDKKLATARKAGATHTINTTAGNLHKQLSELTNGRGPDVMIEAIGLPQTYRAAVEEVAFSGRVVYIGYAKDEVAYETRLFVQKELSIFGSRNALPEDFREVIRMLESHSFPVEDTVTHVVPFEDTPAILESWNRQPSRFTKIMVEVA